MGNGERSDKKKPKREIVGKERRKFVIRRENEMYERKDKEETE
jgi:hypothetical protein